MSIKVGCCGFQHGMKEYFRQFKMVEVVRAGVAIRRAEVFPAPRRAALPAPLHQRGIEVAKGQGEGQRDLHIVQQPERV